MEKKLARLLDYQKYSPNPRLSSIIDNVESRYDLEDHRLSDYELGMVSAAGNAEFANLKETPPLIKLKQDSSDE